MMRPDGPGAGPSNSFVSGNPALGIPATTVQAKLMQAWSAEFNGLVEAGGLTPDQNGVDVTQVRQAILQITGARPGLLNLLFNGNFRIWQRDSVSAGVSVIVSAAAGEKYTADRWFCRSDGGAGSGSASTQRQPFTVGQSVVPGNPEHFFRYLQTAAASLGPPFMGQRIEDVMRFHSRQLTFSAWLNPTVSMDVSMIATQKFGSGGSADVSAGSNVFHLTAGWQKVFFTFTTPSISGKTLGPGSSLEVGLQMPQGLTFTLDAALAQVEYSSTPSPFDLRPLAIEIGLCKRYYQHSWPLDTARVTADEIGMSYGNVQNNVTPNDRMWGLNTRFPVEMRTAPSLLWFSANGTANRVEVLESTGHLQVVSSTLSSSTNCTGYPVTDYVAGSGAYICRGHWEADAEL